VAATNINRIVMTGNLTADPELRSLPSGTSVCSMRIACNTRRKNASTGEWEDKPNYFNVTVWGAQGENVARYLSKGRPVAIDGRMEWREWEAQDGSKRQATDIIADSVQFLGSPGESSAAGGERFGEPPAAAAPGGEGVRIDQGDFEPAPVAPGGDDDIPF
jgi:single-strand DNA-binding protein